MKKILIVDDSQEIREIVKTTLDTDEYKVLEASSGQKAVEIAKKEHPDLIIMDLVMPGDIDGIEATKRIKDDPEIKKCKIIILTGSENIRRTEGIEAGACDIFIKPFSPLDLLTHIELLLDA
jgi:two-component system, OmpR family, phosphate regulon response regulator PhoB